MPSDLRRRKQAVGSSIPPSSTFCASEQAFCGKLTGEHSPVHHTRSPSPSRRESAAEQAGGTSRPRLARISSPDQDGTRTDHGASCAAVALAGRLFRAGVATRRNIRPVDQLRTRREGMPTSNCENEFVGRLAGADAPNSIVRHGGQFSTAEGENRPRTLTALADATAEPTIITRVLGDMRSRYPITLTSEVS